MLFFPPGKQIYLNFHLSNKMLFKIKMSLRLYYSACLWLALASRKIIPHGCELTKSIDMKVVFFPCEYVCDEPDYVLLGTGPLVHAIEMK